MNPNEQFRPSTVSDMIGNDESRAEFLQWWSSFDGNEHVILEGPPGVGKTTIAQAIASQTDRIFTEINASDLRTKRELNDEIGPIVNSVGFEGEGRVILVDEVDNLDRGGSTAMCSLMDDASQPMILTCNDYWDGVSSSIRDRCKHIEFGLVDDRKILHYLRRLCEQEDISYDERSLKLIVDRSMGDVRAAINDLFSSIEQEIIHRNDDLPDRKMEFLVIGPSDIDPSIVHRRLDQIDNESVYHLRGTRGFDEAIATYAMSNRDPFELCPPSDEGWNRSPNWDTFDHMARFTMPAPFEGSYSLHSFIDWYLKSGMMILGWTNTDEKRLLDLYRDWENRFIDLSEL